MASGQACKDLCTRGNTHAIGGAREALAYEVRRYNERQVHSVTGEIPVLRFEKALQEGKSLFRPFKVPSPYESSKDIFSIREERTTDAYRKISIDGIELRVPGVDPYEKVELRMIPDEETGLTEIRFWYNKKLIGTQRIKTSDLKRVYF